jgi:hypothetical protein
LQVGDVSIIHPGASSSRRTAASTAGTAAAQRDEQKRLGKLLMRLLGDLGEHVQAAESGQGLFTKQQFVQGALWELTVCLCRYNAMLERGVAGFFVKAGGVSIKHGLTEPSADISDIDWNAWIPCLPGWNTFDFAQRV